MTTSTYRTRLAAMVALLAVAGLRPAAVEAGPLSDLLWGGSSEDHYYPIGREYVRANSSPANPVTAYYTPAPGTAPVATVPVTSVPVTSAPAAMYPAPSGTTSYYAPAPSGSAAYAPQRTTVLSPPVAAAAAAAPAMTYRLTSPVVTAPVAAAPISGVQPTGALLPAVPYTAGYATTVGAVATSAVPTTAYYANSAANVASCNTCAVPAPSYRTVWYRVPVTNYRPVTSTDPCTGCPTTVMRPCTTYAWQARRVPDERPRSWFSRLFCCFHKRPAPPATALPVVAPVAVTSNCAPATTYGCPPAAATSAPYYTAPGAVVAPATTAPATSVPTTTPGYTTPGYTTPGYTTPGYTTPGTYPGAAPSSGVPLREPADYPPTLSPTTSPPASSSPAPLREGSAYPPAINGSQNGSYNGSNGSNGTNGNGTHGNHSDNGDDADMAPESRNGQTSNSSSIILGPATGSAHDPRLSPQPVPDPDAMMNTQKRFDPPRLLNPRDRSASHQVQRAGAFVLISWPEVKTVSAEEPAPVSNPPAAPAPRPAPRVDDGGWRSIR